MTGRKGNGSGAEPLPAGRGVVVPWDSAAWCGPGCKYVTVRIPRLEGDESWACW